jgi:GNAT superfamily N-acetyltransferase
MIEPTAMRVFELEPGRLDEARTVLAAACAFDPAAAVAEEKLFGQSATPTAALGVADGERLVGVAVSSGRWLRLLAVHPDARRRGCGSALLDEAAARARRSGAARLRTGDQPGNYLAPGIDARNEETVAFFEKRGFVEVARNRNLIVRLVDNEHVTPSRAEALADAAARRGYDIRRATPDDEAALLELARGFGPAWAFEVALALGNRPPTVHVAAERASGQLTAFACVDANNRGLGWFGPAGTRPEHRGHGLGQALLVPCLLDAAAAGHRETEIAWIGPQRFYESAAGARPGRSFVVLEKELA